MHGGRSAILFEEIQAQTEAPWGIMNLRVLATTSAAVVLAGLALQHAMKSPRGGEQAAAIHSSLPAVSMAKVVLNSTHRHREWVNVPFGSTGVRAFIVYPERSDKAPVVVVTENKQSASDWIRAVSDQLAAEGFIAVVPDVLSGLAPNGGDTDSFSSADAIAAATARMDVAEMMRRTNAARDSALALPAANGKSASLEFYPDGAGDSQIVAVVVSASGEKRASFPPSAQAWAQAIGFLNRETGNRPAFGSNPNVPEDHSAHIAMAMAQTKGDGQQKGGGFGGRGYPTGKLPDLPAGIFNAHSTLENSKLRKEFVDIPVGDVKLHTWIEYPEGNGKAPIVLVMHHGPGLDDWQRALGDQLAQQGFIAITPDLLSGFGPNGGNYDSFDGTDAVMRGLARLTQDEGIRRLKAAYEYGMKLPRASGKSAAIGFCMGGGYSFRFAGEVPEVNGAVVFYGGPPSEQIMAKIKVPVLGFFGEDDARVTAAVAPATAQMQKLGKTFETHIYPHATHGFLEFQDLAGNPQATSDSWAKTIAYLKERTT
jgi:carboxymethylenebutenolidase